MGARVLVEVFFGQDRNDFGLFSKPDVLEYLFTPTEADNWINYMTVDEKRLRALDLGFYLEV